MTDIKHFLQNQKSKDGEKNLYEHLTNILGKILLENPKNAFDVFENYSHEIKDTGYDYKQPSAFEGKTLNKENYSEIQSWAEKTRSILDKSVNEEGEKLGQVGYVPNLFEEMRKFEYAGINFSETELFVLQNALAKLANDLKAKSIRFWGKILGSDKDYLIVEADMEGNAPEGVEDPQPDDPNAKGFEARGQPGINQLNYYVASDVNGEWKPLPAITPKQLICARQVKHIFSGNLEAEIIKNPPYPGKEKHLLRAQIARIQHGTNIIPRGLYKINLESDDATPEQILESREVIEEEPETLKQPTVEELAKLQNWVHYTPAILKEGKVTYSEPPETVDPEKLPQWEAARKKRDPYELRLKSISQDKPLTGYNSAWTVKFAGDTISYDTISQNKAKTSYGVAVVKSLVWPGSTTIAFGKKWQSIYVGYGFKASIKPYFPILVQPVFAEPPDGPENIEPQGKVPEQVINDGQNEPPEEQ